MVQIDWFYAGGLLRFVLKKKKKNHPVSVIPNKAKCNKTRSACKPIKGILHFCYSAFDLQHFSLVPSQDFHLSAYTVHLSCVCLLYPLALLA